jgi:hypothetical protein
MSSLGMVPVDGLAGQAKPTRNETATIKAGMRRSENIQRMNRNREIKRMRLENRKWSERDQTVINKDTIQSALGNRSAAAWGDDMAMTTDHCRIMYNNCNGISTNLEYGKCHDIGDSAHEMNVYIGII